MLTNHELTTLRAECLRYARVLTRDPDLAEDLVQDTLMAMLRLEVCGERPLAYAKRAVYNRFISHIRKTTFRDRALSAQAHDEPCTRWEPDNESGELVEQLERLEREIPYYGTVLRALSVDGLSMRELADRLGIPVGTIMSRSHRARALVRKRLAERKLLEADIEVKVERRLADPAVPERRVRARAG